ncbi:DUF1684 domain-containing protein [Pontibacter liquoris]|uniref:DUF1684 domain-containing protein n=1 Tax=Pontibacter liquoris TaxID=2905677 RepID=UPI001FA6D1D0|nr:DUF1684 domain-containing protein [Pontibacter liquoris]
MTYFFGKLLALFAALLLLAACTQQEKAPAATTPLPDTETAYVDSVNQWHHEREENLKKEDGWLSLAGLFWLKEGKNTFGSGDGNDLVFPEGKLPAQAGVLTLDHGKVTASIAKGVDVKLNGKPVQQEALVYTEGQEPPQMTYGPLTWFVLKRGDRYGIRLRDAESPVRTAFKGVDRFPVATKWRLPARLEQNPLPKQIPITNILGQTEPEPSPGALVFTVGDSTYRLDALEEGDELFIIFADKTNGTDTYGSGRYLYVPKPGPDGSTTIDFNKATNPPCAFVPYATCPLPPKQNFLPLSITAGEKTYGHQ